MTEHPPRASRRLAVYREGLALVWLIFTVPLGATFAVNMMTGLPLAHLTYAPLALLSYVAVRELT